MSLSAREQKLLRGLARRKVREAEGLFLAEGVRVVEDLLASPLRTRLLVGVSTLEDSERGATLLRGAGHAGVPVRIVEPALFAEFAETETPQGVLAVAEMPRARLSDLLEEEGDAVLLALDAVQDPGNFGVLVRTAEALGARGVLTLPGTVDAWNPKAVRSAVGSSFRLPIVATEWEVLAGAARGAGFRVLASAAGGEPLGTPPRRALLVMGNEGAGVSAEALSHADRVVGIPLRGRAESLNVSAAAAILLHDLLR
jgi:TrmH family RNA methyltransferase